MQQYYYYYFFFPLYQREIYIKFQSITVNLFFLLDNNKANNILYRQPLGHQSKKENRTECEGAQCEGTECMSVCVHMCVVVACTFSDPDRLVLYVPHFSALLYKYRFGIN